MSSGTFGTGTDELLHGVGFNLCVPCYDNKSCNGDGESLVVPKKNLWRG